MSSSQADSQVCGCHFFGQGAIRSGMNSGDHYLQPQPRHTEIAGWLIGWASQTGAEWRSSSSGGGGGVYEVTPALVRTGLVVGLTLDASLRGIAAKSREVAHASAS